MCKLQEYYVKAMPLNCQATVEILLVKINEELFLTAPTSVW